MNWKKSLQHGLAAFGVLRVLSSAGAWFAVKSMHVGETVAVPGYAPKTYSGLADALLAPWLRSDALWYLKAATVGYIDGQTFAFFPAFPAFTRLFALLFREELVAALVVSNLATIAGLVLAHRLFKGLVGEARAVVATWAIALFPTSFFFVAPYAESLLLAAGCGALLKARERKWIPAAVFAAIAVLSRPFGILLVIPMFFIARGGRGWLRWLPLMASAGALLGWAAFAASKTGQLTALLQVQQTWQREPTLFLLTVYSGIRAVWTYRGSGYSFYMAVDLAALMIGIALVAAALLQARREREPSMMGSSLYGVAALLLPLSSMFPGRPLLSFPRFMLGLFPCAWALGAPPVGGPRAWLYPSLAVLSGIGLLVATALYIAARPLY